MRKTIIAGNWKMYKTIAEAIELANGLKRELFDLNPQLIEIVICPAFTALSEVRDVISDSNLQLGAQDVFWEDEGAFTGEVSCLMLKDIGCRFVIIGHSERRQYFAETNEVVNKKARTVLRHGLIPIVCVGETLSEREKGLTFKVLEDHIYNGLKQISKEDILRVIIAYEPVWAIGTGRTATAEQAQEAQSYIRSLLAKMYDKQTAQQVRIQYGGSVKPENISELVSQPDVDGALVGLASLNLESFVKIVKRASQVRK
ncbi:MAG: triose-phosphate isomerase [Candidatus Omnitrophica bacterium]|nr:triose-phosphate isomerase [Candidatus Omnitrophota bacterium]